MPLVSNRYGKGHVRVMRVSRDTKRHEVRELDVQTMLEGDFAEAYTVGDNRRVIATDTIKNIAYIVAREALSATAEQYGERLARRFLELYPQVRSVEVSTQETRWLRATIDGVPHDHSFTLDGNGHPTARVQATRDAIHIASGIAGYTFLKSTESGWVDFVRDDFTTLPDTADRLAATAMDAEWSWLGVPQDYQAANALVLQTMLTVFATTYSRGIQDSLLRMGEAALAAVPELLEIRMACPNKHYLPANLAPFGLSADNCVFIATHEPHGQIECTVGR